MIQINSDNRKTGAILKKLVHQIQGYGGWINDSVVLKCSHGELAVHTQAHASGADNIFAFPPECLIPVDKFKLDLSGDRIVLSSHDPDLDPERLALLETMIALFNETDKASRHKASSPWMLNLTNPDLFREIIKGRSEQVYPELKDSLHGEADHKQLIVKSLLKTRVIGFTSSTESRTRTQMLMPIIDLVNHHPLAPTYTNYVDQKGKSRLTVKEFYAPPADTECFVRYGYYDSFDLYLVYGYVDPQTYFVRSIPLEISLPEGGSIKIHSTCHHPTPKSLPPQLADLQVYLPDIAIDQTTKCAETGFLLIPNANAPHALRRVLALVLKNMDATLEQKRMMQLIEFAETQLLQENRAFYERLLSLIKSAGASSNDGQHRQLELTASMARLQLEKLAAYPFA